MEIPLSMDHLGHLGVKSIIRLGKVYEKYNLSWIEDVIPWTYTDLLKQIADQSPDAHSDRRRYLFEGTISGFVSEPRGRQDSAGSRHRWRHLGNSQNRRHGRRLRRSDGFAFRWNPDLLHGQRASRSGHAEFPGAGTPLPRCAMVVFYRARRNENANRQSRLDRSAGSSRPRRNSKRRCSSPTLGPWHRLFRAHPAVGQRTLLGPPLELDPCLCGREFRDGPAS